MKKRAQQTMGLPFGMIFAIILIVVFVIIAFIAIRHFLDIGKTADVGLFYEDLQKNVDNAWKGQSGEFTYDINLPEKIDFVCFANLTAPNVRRSTPEYKLIENHMYEDANVFLLPPEYAAGMAFKRIEHINITKITKIRNPYCVNAKSSLVIKKGFYDALVIIE